MLSHLFFVDFDKLFVIFSLETAILSCGILGSGAIVPVLGCILANTKKLETIDCTLNHSGVLTSIFTISL